MNVLFECVDLICIYRGQIALFNLWKAENNLVGVLYMRVTVLNDLLHYYPHLHENRRDICLGYYSTALACDSKA